MSWYRIGLKVWHSPKGETRVYINTSYVDYRILEHNADGGYFTKAEDGSIKAHCKPSMSGIYGEAVYAVMSSFGLDGISFDDLLSRIAACQTAKGNFSARSYEKKYLRTT
jgi:hypothetical protein